jgi:ABC-type antimicrobial peptide transport system permease subunit
MLVQKYWHMDVMVQRQLRLVVRSKRTGSPGLLKEIQSTVQSVNADVPVTSVRTLDEIYRRSMASTSFMLVMLAIAGAVALLLGLIGIYGVVSYSVSQRKREIGIRMALGAEHSEVRGLFVRHALMLTAVGVASGAAAAIAVTRALSALLYGVSALDPLTFAGVTTLLTVAALLASYLPARRATSVDPARALRAE